MTLTAESETGANRSDRLSDELLEDFGEPIVGRRLGSLSTFLFFGVLATLAVGMYFVLNNRRLSHEEPAIAIDRSAPENIAAPPGPLVFAKLQVLAPAPFQKAEPAPVPTAMQMPADSINLKAPAVVVDLLSASQIAPPKPAASASDKAGQGTASGANEQFAAHASESAPESSVATQMVDLSTLVTQGSIIPGVLETAINSDLPGYTRALVSRDVHGFDGKAVLIPRGSRLIGQYKNAISVGQARVFIIWTRVIRPDGVSIQIGSPGDDSLGRGGVTGEINSHFFARFGGAVLLSLLNVGTAAASGAPSTQISIGSPQSAMGTIPNALPQENQILPTIDVAQGTPINIFVSRDLDFSAVNPIP